MWARNRSHWAFQRSRAYSLLEKPVWLLDGFGIGDQRICNESRESCLEIGYKHLSCKGRMSMETGTQRIIIFRKWISSRMLKPHIIATL